ncbi:BREX-1 system phosphatase PglZ type B [Deinococcus detaillensis]|uniref:BREX-1 system phosphatase PglZ type B n=1 Tax=Deinococcus detaillensis TaxID=2592048 RepID=A0A553UPJ8_9DEIO|nr:BREX-1 system phosphatase PglZ type B [Deinococcus detaillensis]TSA82143.1 BREX-1 system phosphatase PglZ type B [Deinococcus detaillensis]
MTTVLDMLESALLASVGHQRGEVVAPACILWPDPTGEWQTAAEQLRVRRSLLTLGTYAPHLLSGPAIWIRSVVDARPAGQEPVIVYLPGLGLEALRGETAADVVKPLVDLQFRGVVFLGPRKRPWTVSSFLREFKELKVEVADSARPALVAHLEALLEQPVQNLRSYAPLTLAALSRLTFPDLPGQLLAWLSDGSPPVSQALASAFASEFGVDVSGGVSEAALKLAARTGALTGVWERYAASPDTYGGIRSVLEAAGPAPSGAWTPEQAQVWPQVNRAAEAALRSRLQALVDQPAGAVREQVLQLEQEHAVRRTSVWGRLGETPLACALEHLAELAVYSAGTLDGETVAEWGAAYASGGYRADLSALQAQGAVQSDADLELVGAVLRGPYLEWLTRVNDRFTSVALAAASLPTPWSASWVPSPGLAVVFVDGLRFDVAAMLARQLSPLSAELTWQMSALPSITPSAKPAVAPIGAEMDVLSAEKLTLACLGRSLNAAVLRDLLTQRGFRAVRTAAEGDPGGAVWLETGNLDSLGHSQGAGLAGLLPGEVRKLGERVQGLLAAGFTEVRIITDHGWLLLPGGLPKVDLPGALTLFKKGRCAVLKGLNASAYPTVPWTWDADVPITLAPGVHSFEAGEVYTHGGLSLQESIIPVVTVRAQHSVMQAEFVSVRWTGNRCRVKLTGGVDLTVDLRRRAADPQSSLLTGAKIVAADGSVSLLVEDDDLTGTAAVLVALHQDQLIRQKLVTVGENA